MTDQDRPDEPQFDDPAHDGVRGLLASAKVTDPVPADVAARLDATLASLTADRRGEAVDAHPDAHPENPPVVVPLRRRSRLAPRLLAAAAAVVVVGAGGIGLAQVLGNQGSDQATTATADSATASGSENIGPPSPEAPAPEATRDEASGGLSTLKGFASNKAVPRFTTAGFTSEVAAFSTRDLDLPWEGRLPTEEDNSLGAGSGDSGPDPSENASPSPGLTATDKALAAKRSAFARLQRGNQYFAAQAACPGPVGIDATLVPILYDGQPASLAVHPEQAETQLYEAWSCDGLTLLALSIVPR